MGGRGASSATSRVRLPLGASGLVSTDVSDYAGMSQEQIMDGISRLDYEVAALFNSNGQLVGIATDGDTSSTVSAPSALGAYAYARDHPADDGPMTHFHNHPLGRDTMAIFSG